MKQKIIKNISYGLGLAKAMNYTAQGALLPLIDSLAQGQNKKNFKDFKKNLQLALPKVEKVLKKDAENIALGLYPPTVLFEENPVSHYLRVPRLLADAFRASRQRLNRKSDVFDAKDSDYITEVPEYYRRNFHFQKGGYLNDESAELYDHQVEVLFSGTAQAMRRMIIPSLKKHFETTDGEGLKFLEIGSGTGTLTRLIAEALPKAQITCVDLSPHYLNHAHSKLKKYKRIDFVRGHGENLSFKDNTFDAVFSCYLFHELPESIRKKVLKEKLRVLKPAGYLGLMDSIQKDDDETLNWALREFPTQFHEPFFKNYVDSKIEDRFADLAVSEITTEINFLTKLVTATKI